MSYQLETNVGSIFSNALTKVYAVCINLSNTFFKVTIILTKALC